MCWRSKTVAIYFVRGCRETYSLLGESSFRFYKYILRLGLLLYLLLLFDGSFGFLNFLRGMNSVVVRVKLELCVECLLEKLLVKIWEHLRGLFLGGELMLIKDAFDFSPFVECVFSDHRLAVDAQVFDFCLVGIALVAEVVEVDVHDKVRRNDFAFVFANVFWTQLHLSSLDVVASLDESCVEHDAEHGFVGEASVSKDDLHIALKQ